MFGNFCYQRQQAAPVNFAQQTLLTRFDGQRITILFQA